MHRAGGIQGPQRVLGAARGVALGSIRMGVAGSAGGGDLPAGVLRRDRHKGEIGGDVSLGKVQGGGAAWREKVRTLPRRWKALAVACMALLVLVAHVEPAAAAMSANLRRVIMPSSALAGTAGTALNSRTTTSQKCAVVPRRARI